MLYALCEMICRFQSLSHRRNGQCSGQRCYGKAISPGKYVRENVVSLVKNKLALMAGCMKGLRRGRDFGQVT